MISLKTAIALSCLCGATSILYVTTHTVIGQSNVATVLQSNPTSTVPMKNQDITEPEAPSAPKPPLQETGSAEIKQKAPTPPQRTLKVPTNKKTIEAAPAINPYSFETLTQSLHARTNSIRSKNNLRPLVYDAALSKLATKRSVDMATRNYFSHTSPDGCDLTCRFEKAEYVTLSFGENLAEYSDYALLSESDLAEYFMNKWLKSSNHKKNLLSSDFTNEGIGVALQGKKIIVTVVFAKS